MDNDIYIQKMAVDYHDAGNLKKFYQKYLKSADFNAYCVETGWEDMCDATNTSYSIVLSNLSDTLLNEGIRQSLGLPYCTNAHAYERRMTDGFSVDYMKLKEKNKYQEILDHIDSRLDSYEGLNSSIGFYSVWYLTSHVDLDKGEVIIDAYKLTDHHKVATVLDTFASERQKELAKQKKQEQEEKANERLNDIIKLISKMSVANKQKVLQALVK